MKMAIFIYELMHVLNIITSLYSSLALYIVYKYVIHLKILKLREIQYVPKI